MTLVRSGMQRFNLCASRIRGVQKATERRIRSSPRSSRSSSAAADGNYHIPRGAPAYSAKLDRDGDGLACEG
ncbi:excalibur calcium-binding domain-containing protein [Mycobacteroides saopaulense]|uniref:excalibur calcium-binding domain-containing protein n=1 Tax=Mycobacteroides saopaulense TaxID=1578165 RepID=UPI000B4CDDA5